jgi:hypothetical protein
MGGMTGTGNPGVTGGPGLAGGAAYARGRQRARGPARRCGLPGPAAGFGRMWHKAYRVNLADRVTSRRAVAAWKDALPRLYPPGSQLAVPLGGLTPADAALLAAATGGVTLSTGVTVLYADDESCTLASPAGHRQAAWLTVSAEQPAQRTILRAQLLMRAGDPLSELAATCGGHGREDRCWVTALTMLAESLGEPGAAVQVSSICLDSRRQWRHAGNMWHSAMVRGVLRAAAAPLGAARLSRPALPRSGPDAAGPDAAGTDEFGADEFGADTASTGTDTGGAIIPGQMF